MLLLYHSEDPAAQNMVSQLLKIAEWRREGEFFIHGNFHLLEIDERIANLEKLEARKFGDFDSMMILSRHASKSGNRVVTTHFTGKIAEDDFRISVPAPELQFSLMRELKKRIPDDFALSLECTHHGPYETDVPSLFVEIGSTESEWRNREVAHSVAMSILEMKIENPPIVCVSFGGGHYAPRQTKILLRGASAFAHIVPNHLVGMMTEERIEKLFEISRTVFCHLDRKSMNSEMRRTLEALLENYIQISEGNLMMKPRGEVYRRIAEVIENPVLTERVNESSQEFHRFSKELFNIVMSVDAERAKKILSENCGAYSRDGSILMCSQEELRKVLVSFLELLSSKYSIRVDEGRGLILEKHSGGKIINNSGRIKEVRLSGELMEILKGGGLDGVDN
ncbi:MAG: D-aminoacyl-tRNA deacylase [Archaeoglobi archaeon]|nr:hypothetical protein [Candidatus Mnemosynella bozhongmuii]MDI3502479.1 D-aminoacyl-tRNA deacylase [Archaeoglobi archaeon]